MKSHFHMSTKTRFEKEAKGNSEMPYLYALNIGHEHYINYLLLNKAR